MKNERSRKDITQEPDSIQTIDAYLEFGDLVRQRFPGIDIPGAEIVVTEEPQTQDLQDPQPSIHPTGLSNQSI